VAEEDSGRRGAHCPRRNHIVRFAQRQEAAPQQTGENGGVRDPDGQHDLDLALTEPGDDADGEQDAGHGQQHVDEAHQEPVKDAACAAGHCPNNAAEDQAKEDRHGADGQADPRAVQDPTELVAPEEIRAHQVRWARALLTVNEDPDGRIVGSEHRREDGSQNEDGDEDKSQDGGAIAEQPPQRVPPQPSAGARRGSYDYGCRRGSHVMST
jgi:hypothetical protein